MSNFSKWATRIFTIALGGASKLLGSFSNFIISIVVVRTQSITLWGELIPYLVTIDLALTILSWGSTSYLLREFSLRPNEIKLKWNESICSRGIPLLFLMMSIFVLPWPFTIKVWLIVLSVFRFVHQSFEPIAQTERHFSFTLLIEMISIGVVITPIIVLKKIDLNQLLMLLTTAAIFKAALLAFFYRRMISFSGFKISFFVASFPYFLVAIGTMLQQRTDLLVATFFLSKKDIAMYQVLLSLLVLCQSILSLVLNPYIKNIYRLNRKSLLLLEKKFMTVGTLLSALGLAVVFLILQYIYVFNINGIVYLLGFFYVATYSFYAFRIHEINRLNKQLIISKYLFLSSLVSLVASMVLIPLYGITGALLSGLLGQLFIVFLYRQPNISLRTETTATA